MKTVKRNACAAGFSLMELLLVIIIIGVLASVLSPSIINMTRNAKEAKTKGNLASLRSAITIYYGDNTGIYPADQLQSLTANSGKYIQTIPFADTPNYHVNSNGIVNSTSDANGWTYDNNSADQIYGTVWVNCTHTDTRGTTWTAY